jgi:hypothetical protein
MVTAYFFVFVFVFWAARRGDIAMTVAPSVIPYVRGKHTG